MNMQYKFLKTIARCERNGEATEDNIRRVWKNCPDRAVLLNLGRGELFEYNYRLDAPAYSLTWQGREYIRNCETNAFTVAVTSITLVLTVISLLLQIV